MVGWIILGFSEVLPALCVCVHQRPTGHLPGILGGTQIPFGLVLHAMHSNVALKKM